MGFPTLHKSLRSRIELPLKLRLLPILMAEQQQLMLGHSTANLVITTDNANLF